MPWHKELDKLTERWLGASGSGPPAGASARPTPTRSAGSASASRTCSTRGSWPRRSRRCCASATRCWPRSTTGCPGRRGDRRGVHHLRRGPAAPDRRHLAVRLERPPRGQAGAVRGRPGDPARRGPRHLPVRDLVLAGGRRRPAPGPGSGPAGSTRHRASPRRMRPGSAPARSRPRPPTPRPRACGRPATSSAPPPAGRAAAAGWTRWRCATRPGSTGSPSCS